MKTVDDKPRSGRQRHVPFSEHLGLRAEKAQGGGDSSVTLELRPEMLNHHASGHGGVVMTSWTCASPSCAPPAVAKGRATGWPLRVLLRGTITDASGEVAAQAMGTLRYRDGA